MKARERDLVTGAVIGRPGRVRSIALIWVVVVSGVLSNPHAAADPVGSPAAPSRGWFAAQGPVTPIEIDVAFEPVARIAGMEEVLDFHASGDGSHAIVAGRLTDGSVGIWVAFRGGDVIRLNTRRNAVDLKVWVSGDGRHVLVETVTERGRRNLYRASAPAGWATEPVRLPAQWRRGYGNRLFGDVVNMTEAMVEDSGTITLAAARGRRSGFFSLQPDATRFVRTGTIATDRFQAPSRPGVAGRCGRPDGNRIEVTGVATGGAVWSRSVRLQSVYGSLNVCVISADGTSVLAGVTIATPGVGSGFELLLVAVDRDGSFTEVPIAATRPGRPMPAISSLSPSGDRLFVDNTVIDLRTGLRHALPVPPRVLGGRGRIAHVVWSADETRLLRMHAGYGYGGLSMVDLAPVRRGSVAVTTEWLQWDPESVVFDGNAVGVFRDAAGFGVVELQRDDGAVTVVRQSHGRRLRIDAMDLAGDGSAVWSAGSRRTLGDDGDVLREGVVLVLDRG